MDVKALTADSFIQNEDNYISSVKDHLDEIPYLNVISVDEVKDEAFVRFRGMVQDMHTSEYYLDKYEIRNNNTGNIIYKCGRYKDIIECQENETINQYSSQNVTKERQSLVVVSVPGLNNWVTDIERSKYGHGTETSFEMSETKRNKRSLEIDDINYTAEANMNNSQSSENSETSKKFCEENKPQTPSNQVLCAEYLLNLPLPDRGGKVCIVKVYESDPDIKLNEVFDFVGFISLDPRMAQTRLENALFEEENTEILAHHPPPSLIPRVQVIYRNRVDHVNPLITVNTSVDAEKASMLCKELKMILTEVLLGDSLAATYLFYHLMSTVYLRKDLSILGKFTLNLSNIPQSLVEQFGISLYEIIEILVTHSHYLPMTLENMNELTFIPRKDLEANRLNSSVLQLADNTHLVLDETKLSPGTLNSAGCQAIAALNRLIKDQDISYDFKVYNVNFNHNIPILIISEGKSMLPSDYHVILQPNNVHVDTYAEVFPAAKLLLTQELLSDLRQYLTVSRHRNHEISRDIESLIEEDFVKFRREYDIAADDLHRLLDIARLVTFGDGKTSIDKHSWRTACKLEEERWQRIRRS